MYIKQDTKQQTKILLKVRKNTLKPVALMEFSVQIQMLRMLDEVIILNTDQVKPFLKFKNKIYTYSQFY